MLLVNISREKIILQGKEFVEELEYMDIERRFPALLLEVIEKHAIKSIWVINGPGSFTTLRLGCLTVNTIKQFSDTALDIYACSKLDIYGYAVEQGFLPSLGLVYIGQKKNMWSVKKTTDYRSHLPAGQAGTTDEGCIDGWEYEIINHKTVGILLGQEYFIDACEHMIVDSLERERMVEWGFDGEKLKLSFQQTLDSRPETLDPTATKKSITISLEDLGLEPVENVEPRYMSDPQIG